MTPINRDERAAEALAPAETFAAAEALAAADRAKLWAVNQKRVAAETS